MKLKEYFTPDSLDSDDGKIALHWKDDNAYPFLVFDGEIVYGDFGEAHLDILPKIIYSIMERQGDYFDDGEFVIKQIYESNYSTLPNGDIKVDDYGVIKDELYKDIIYWLYSDGRKEIGEFTEEFGRIWVKCGKKGESYISVWLNNRLYFNNKGIKGGSYNSNNMFDVDNSNMAWKANEKVPGNINKSSIYLFIEVFRHFDCDLNKSFVCIGNTVMPINNLISGEEKFNITKDDMEQSAQAMADHLKPAKEKWEITKDWRQQRDARNQEKYFNHTPSQTEAEWRAMIYQENKNNMNTIDRIISESLSNFLNEEGIHIKKENEGKFTATKKATGKSTEELTHSKNPLTRKRAVFALNAKHWNHNKKKSKKN